MHEYVVVFCNEFGDINPCRTPIPARGFDAARAICRKYRSVDDASIGRIYRLMPYGVWSKPPPPNLSET